MWILKIISAMPWKGGFVLVSAEGFRVNQGKDSRYCVLLDPERGEGEGGLGPRGYNQLADWSPVATEQRGRELTSGLRPPPCPLPSNVLPFFCLSCIPKCIGDTSALGW